MDRIFEAYNGIGGFSREFMRKSRERLHWTCSQVWGRKVLDVGCSQGIGPILLGRMGYEVLGIDVNPEAIAFAKGELEKESDEVRRRVQFDCVDFNRFNKEEWNQVDAIVMGEVLEHLVRPADFINKAFRLLKPAGKLIVTVPFGINDDPDHRQTFYLTNIYTLLFPFFDITGIKFFGSWIGFIAKRREQKSEEQPQIPLSLFRQAEEAFYNVERPLRDEILNAKAAVKRANDAAAAAKSNVGNEVEVVETKVGELTTALEVEKNASRGYQEQIAVLKAMLQFVSSQQKPAEKNPVDEQRLLSYSQEARELKNENGALRDANSDLKTKLAVTEVECAHLSKELSKVEATVSAAERKAAEALEMAEMYEAENDEVRSKESSLVKAIETLSAEKQELELAKEELAERYAALEAQREQSQAAIVRIAGERTRLDQELAQLRLKLSKSYSDAESLRNKLVSTEAASEEAIQTAETLKRDIKRIKESNAVLKLEVQQGRNRLETSVVKAETLAEENKVLKETLIQTKSTVDKISADLEAHKAAAESALSAAVDKAAELEAKNDLLASEHKQQMSLKDSEISSINKSLKQKEGEIRKLRQEKNAFEKASSRLTVATEKVLSAYHKLATSKLGRLTLRYWRFKDKFDPESKIKTAQKLLAASAVRMVVPPQSFAVRYDAIQKLGMKYDDVRQLLKSVKVACIMDEFTWKSYSPEANMIQLTPADYLAQLEGFKPELIFVESAWRGVDEKWTNIVHKIPDELKGILSWAKKHGVPTAFWNKEDPIHFDTFKNVASLFDYIFTYDFNCVQKYKEITGKDNAFFLPMAVQPSMFNPIEKYERKDAFCFAGSYYRRYVDRTKDLDGYIKAFPAYRGVEIYDRQFGKNDPNYMMPPEYAPYIKGNLPYDQIDRAYKGYMYSINLNSIKQANSIARRVFELLACNTVTVSNYSYGVVTGFGDLVITSDNADVLIGKIKEYASKPYGLDKFRLLGLRKVFSENTYTDRFAYICSKVFGVDLTRKMPRVALIASVDNAEEYARVQALFKRQQYENKELIVCSKCTSLGPDVVLDCADVLNRLKGFDYVGALSADDYYAEHYLEDLVYGFRYSNTSAVGKGMYFVANGNCVSLKGKMKPYHFATKIALRRGLVASKAIHSELFGKRGYHAISDVSINIPTLSLDMFNYCENGEKYNLTPYNKVTVSDIVGVDDGFQFSDMQRLAESLQPIQSDANDGPFVSAAELYKLSSGNKCKGVSSAFENGEMRLQSSLGKGEHTYFAIDKLFSVNELPIADGKLPLNLETGYSSSVISRIAYFFLNEEKQKISSALGVTNSNLTIDVPDDTKFVRFQLRLQESGVLEVGNLNFAHKPTPQPYNFDKSDILCLTNHYPSYDNIYRNGFVHTRLKLYEKQGVRTSVFRMTGEALPQFSEFEGVPIVSGNAEYLRFVFENKKYKAIVVHFMDPQMWEVLKEVPQTTRILVWSHGADILLYTRRLFNYTTEDALAKAKIQSNQRAEFWKSVFSNMPPNYKHIFVSDYLRKVVEQDLDIKLPGDKYTVIHNPINTDLFSFEEKDISLRYKLLSIRPFASRKYANDLTVGCILELSKRKDFDKFEITIIGDGPLFDETLAPLRKFSNVTIVRGFLRQSEIKNYHRQNGIFLVPTREDTQGVSRDEAMSSGLIPVTNEVTAIPEFVDKSCGVLAPSEDYMEMAKQISRIVDNPKLFSEMSANATARVRRQTTSDVVVKQELALICT